MDKLKVIELFAGVGTQAQALKNIGVDCEIVATSDIDKYANETYIQIHGPVTQLNDICKIERLPVADLWTYSFPCQDISIAGLRRGLVKGETRSGLLYEVGRLLDVAADNNELPKYLLMENVKNLVGEKFKPVFDQWVSFLEELGYKSYWKVLNARNYGIPQNRERIFCVSILGDHEPFVFPEPQELKLKLKDMLEEEVAPKYYLSDKIQERFVFRKQGSNIVGTTAPDRKIGQRDIVYGTDGVMGALTATDYKQPKQIIEFEMPNGKKAEFDDSIEEPTVFKEVRTELGKQMRRQARLEGKGDTTPRNKDCKKFIPQNNGLANCLTTTIGSEQIVLIPGTIIFTPNGVNGYQKYVVEGDLQIDCSQTFNEESLTDDTTTEEVDTSKYPMTRTEYKEGHLQIIGDIVQSHESSGRCYRKEGISPTLTTGCGSVVKLFEGTEKSYKIRKLTPRECWRLMGWTDEQFDRIHGMSDGQLYKMAGNAIVIQVLEAIFREMFKDRLQ